MANSTRIIIYNTNLKPNDNYIIEDVASFLTHPDYCKTLYTIDNFQYQRIDYEKTIKVNLTQEKVDNFEFNPDYLEIQQENGVFYYFILGNHQISGNCIEFDLQLDVLNSFEGYYDFTEKSQIEREHVDRFMVATRPADASSIDENLKHIYSRTVENLQPQLFRTSSEKLNGEGPKDDLRWYLIYLTDKSTGVPTIELCASDVVYLHNQSGEASYTVNVDLIKQHSYVAFNKFNLSYRTAAGLEIIDKGDLYGTLTIVKDPDYDAIDIHYDDYNDTSKSFAIDRAWEVYVKPVNLPVDLFISNTIGSINSNIDYCRVNYDKITLSTGNRIAITSIKSLDRTDSRITRVIECPYCPIALTVDGNGNINLPDNWNYNANSGRLSSTVLTQEFIREGIKKLDYQMMTQLSLTKSNFLTLDKFAVEDPKTLTSPFYGDFYVYDDNVFQFQREYLNWIKTDYNLRISIDYKQTNNISSMLGFKFKVISGGYRYLKTGYFDEYMISVRNNELPLFTSDYLYYMQNGYNYDKKQLAWQTTGNIFNTLGQAVGFGANLAAGMNKNKPSFSVMQRQGKPGILPDPHELAMTNPLIRMSREVSRIKYNPGISKFVVPSVVSNGVGVITGIYNTIASHIQGEEAIEQKINENKAKAFNVATGDNLNLFDWYSGNQIVHYTFRPDTLNSKLINDYFHLYGYSVGEFKKPDLDSRYFFNYCRGDVDITGRGKAFTPFETNKAYLQAKFSDGVYKIHRRIQTPETWDVKLEHCNLECSVLPESWIE